MFLTSKFIAGLTLGLFLGMVLIACGGIKIYVSDPAQGGFIRKQDKELVLYKDTKGWAGLNAEDMQQITTKYAACQKELESCKAQ